MQCHISLINHAGMFQWISLSVSQLSLNIVCLIYLKHELSDNSDKKKGNQKIHAEYNDSCCCFTGLVDTA